MIHYLESFELGEIDMHMRNCLESVIFQCERETNLRSCVSFREKCGPFSICYDLNEEDVNGFAILRQESLVYGQLLQLVYVKEKHRGTSLAKNIVRGILEKIEGEVYAEPVSKNIWGFLG